VSGGEIAALIAAAAFLLLVGTLAVPILRLRHTVDAATRAINEVVDRAGPAIGKLDITIDQVNTALGQVHQSLDGVNAQLLRVDAIAAHAQQVTATVANLTTVVGAASTHPLVKVAAFGYGLRKAASARRTADQEREVRDRLHEERAGRQATRRRRRWRSS
jgi:ABC-type transporter Mla subunit MlaD